MSKGDVTIDVSKLEEAVERALAGLPHDTGPEVFERIRQLVAGLGAGVALGMAARSNVWVRDALYAMAVADEQRHRLLGLLRGLGLEEEFVGLKFPVLEVDGENVLAGRARELESEASKYAFSARIVCEYILRFGELPEFCRKDFGGTDGGTRPVSQAEGKTARGRAKRKQNTQKHERGSRDPNKRGGKGT